MVPNMCRQNILTCFSELEKSEMNVFAHAHHRNFLVHLGISKYSILRMFMRINATSGHRIYSAMVDSFCRQYNCIGLHLDWEKIYRDFCYCQLEFCRYNKIIMHINGGMTMQTFKSQAVLSLVRHWIYTRSTMSLVYTVTLGLLCLGRI